jgi:dihydrodipicolinate reductase
MKVIIFGATGMVGQAVLRACLRDEAIDSCRVKATFNPWANRLFDSVGQQKGLRGVYFTWSIDTKRHVLPVTIRFIGLIGGVA